MLFWHPLMVSFVMFCASFGVYWHESYKDIAARMEKRLPALEESIDIWLEETATTFPKANPDFSESHHLPSRADVRGIQENVTQLILSLNAVPTPTQGIENVSCGFSSSSFRDRAGNRPLRRHGRSFHRNCSCKR